MNVVSLALSCTSYPQSRPNFLLRMRRTTSPSSPRHASFPAKKRLLASPFRNSWFPDPSLFLVCRSAKRMLGVSPTKLLPVSNPNYTHSSLPFLKKSAVQLQASANTTACDSCPGEIAAAMSIDFIIVRPARLSVSPAIALSACFLQHMGFKKDELLGAHPELKAFYKCVRARLQLAPAVSHHELCSEREPKITAALSGLNRMS
jgi:hypothetical protein